MLIVVALGDSAFVSGAHADGATVEPHTLKAATQAVAEIATAHDVVLTHGNVPQLDMLESREQGAASRLHPSGADVLGAETEGIIGYLLDQELANQLPDRHVAALLTQVVVDADDPAFGAPAQRVGLQFSEAEARELAIGQRWAMARGRGDRFRRVLPSPAPRQIVELDTIRLLVDAGTIVVCAGGGGIPVVLGRDGSLRGVEAVVDKDLAAALLAIELEADMLLLLTDVPAVYTDWPSQTRPLRSASPGELRAMTFPAGSMAPKVEAACRFVEATGRTAGIGALRDAAAILKGESGTLVGN
jgi:carbamate kinase